MSELQPIELPPRVKDQRGRVFNRLMVIDFAGLVTKYDGRRESQWLCRCECGTTKVVKLTNLIAGAVRSCGCLKTEANSAIHRTHGMSRSRVYTIWCGMIKRCCNPKSHAYARYGGRGITVCQRWRESFEAFHADMGDPPTAKHTIEREKNDKGYEPGNCRWATYREQGRNTRRNIMLTFQGRTQSLPDWCDELRLPYAAIKRRLSQGWDVVSALTRPLAMPNTLTVNGETLTTSEWAARAGLTWNCIHRRLRRGCTPEEAINPECLPKVPRRR